MNRFRKALVAAAAVASSFGALAAVPSAAEAVSTDGACTVSAGNPVVTTVNGVRTLQAFGTVRCSVPVTAIDTFGGIQAGDGTVVKSAFATTYNTYTQNFLLRIPCRSAVNRYYRSFLDVDVYYGNGYVSHQVDVTPLNLRSCGV